MNVCLLISLWPVGRACQTGRNVNVSFSTCFGVSQRLLPMHRAHSTRWPYLNIDSNKFQHFRQQSNVSSTWLNVNINFVNGISSSRIQNGGFSHPKFSSDSNRIEQTTEHSFVVITIMADQRSTANREQTEKIIEISKNAYTRCDVPRVLWCSASVV